MDSFKVESVRIKTTPEKAFRYISDPKNLPQWTHAFKGVQNGKAIMATQAGAVEVELRVKGTCSEGTIDWHLTFPDGNVATAYSRLVPESAEYSIYSFILMAPPVPLEQLEGALNHQAHILRAELTKLSAILSEA
jgi:Polyketide cyclase / dehydrase and lipid transport